MKFTLGENKKIHSQRSIDKKPGNHRMQEAPVLCQGSSETAFKDWTSFRDTGRPVVESRDSKCQEQGLFKLVERFVLFALRPVPTWSVGTRFNPNAWHRYANSHVSARNTLQENNLINTCKSLNKILSYMVGDCPRWLNSSHSHFRMKRKWSVTCTEKEVIK